MISAIIDFVQTPLITSTKNAKELFSKVSQQWLMVGVVFLVTLKSKAFHGWRKIRNSNHCVITSGHLQVAHLCPRLSRRIPRQYCALKTTTVTTRNIKNIINHGSLQSISWRGKISSSSFSPGETAPTGVSGDLDYQFEVCFLLKFGHFVLKISFHALVNLPQCLRVYPSCILQWQVESDHL